MKTMRNLLVAAALIVAGNMCAMDIFKEFTKTVDATVYGTIKIDITNGVACLEKRQGGSDYFVVNNGQVVPAQATDKDKIEAFKALPDDKIASHVLPVPAPKPQPKADGWMKSVRNFPSKAGEVVNFPMRWAFEKIEKKIGDYITDNQDRRKMAVTIASRSLTTAGLVGLMYIGWTLTHTSSQEDNDDDADLDVPVTPDTAETN